MSLQDEWGHDPSVQSMRRVFSRMEAIQREVLGRSTLSPFDGRLRGWREEALTLFERAWARATKGNVTTGEEELARLYAYCILRVLRTKGIEVGSEALADDDKLIKFVDEGLR